MAGKDLRTQDGGRGCTESRGPPVSPRRPRSREKAVDAGVGEKRKAPEERWVAARVLRFKCRATVGERPGRIGEGTGLESAGGRSAFQLFAWRACRMPTWAMRASLGV